MNPLLILSAAAMAFVSLAYGVDNDELEIVQNLQTPNGHGASCIALSADGRFAYTASVGGGVVAIFKRDSVTGELSLADTVKAPDVSGPIRVRISPDGNYAAVADANANAVVVFKRDPTGGGLTKVARIGGELKGVVDANLSPGGHFLYTASAASLDIYKLEGDQLSLVQHEDADGKLEGLRPFVISPNGHWLYTVAETSGTLGAFRREEESGKLELVEMLSNEQEGITTLNGAFRLDVSDDGKNVYVSAGRDHGDQAISVFEVKSDGTLKLLQKFVSGMDDFSEFEGGNEIKASPDGKWVFAAASVSDRVFRFSRDTSTGKLTFITSQQVGTFLAPGASGVAFSPDGKFSYVTDQSEKAIDVFKLR